MLSNHHGIGVILLDNKSENPEEVEAILNTLHREKPSIDWAMANKLAKKVTTSENVWNVFKHSIMAIIL